MRHAVTRPLAVAGLAALALALVPAAAAPGPAGGQVASVTRPVPASRGHVLQPTLGFPPTTTYCRTQLHISCYRPAQLQAAYGVKALQARGVTGRGRTIVIVDAFGSPTIQRDLKQFDRTFRLPDPPRLRIIQPAGRVPRYPQGSPLGPADVSGWAGETTLDVEWAHVMAPGASILLVETPVTETEGVQGFPEIVSAESYVVAHNLGDVISQSFGATEQTFPSTASILRLRRAYVAAQRRAVTVLAASGDAGSTDLRPDMTCCYESPVTSWPSTDPLVTSVGGTQLHLDLAGRRTAPDNVWNDVGVFGPDGGAGGGGRSSVFARPSYQDRVRGVTGRFRGTPDISMSAAVDGAVVFYYSFCDYSLDDPRTGRPPLCGPQWHLVGGTSLATPLMAGVVAMADQVARRRLGWIDPALYLLGAGGARNGVVDVTRGSNSYLFCSSACGTSSEVDVTVPGYPAARGYDLASGWGTVDAARFVRALAARR